MMESSFFSTLGESAACVVAKCVSGVPNKVLSVLVGVAIMVVVIVKVKRVPCIVMDAQTTGKKSKRKSLYDVYDFVLSPRSCFSSSTLASRVEVERQFLLDEELEPDMNMCCLCLRNYQKECACRFTCVLCSDTDKATYPSKIYEESRTRYGFCKVCSTGPICIACYIDKKCLHK